MPAEPRPPKIPWSALAHRRKLRKLQRSERAQRLRGLLSGSVTRDDDEAELFSPSEVAEAIGGSPEVVRELARSDLMPAEPRSPKTRKLLISLESIEKYLLGTRHLPSMSELGNPTFCDVFRSRKFSLNRKFQRGDIVTKKRAAAELDVSVHTVSYYIRRGDLERCPLGKRLVGITRKSLDELTWKRKSDARRAVKSAKRQLDSAQTKFNRAEEKWKKVYGQAHVETDRLTPRTRSHFRSPRSHFR